MNSMLSALRRVGTIGTIAAVVSVLSACGQQGSDLQELLSADSVASDDSSVSVDAQEPTDSIVNAQLQIIAKAHFHSSVEAKGGTVFRGPDSSVLQFEEIVIHPLRARVFRIQPEMVHASPVMVAVADGQFIRLGGFAAPDIFSLDSFESAPRDSVSLVQLAVAYSTLVDPYGGWDTLQCTIDGVADTTSPTVARKTPEYWWVVTVTACTRSVYPAEKEVHRYSFRFNNAGHLLAWYRFQVNR